MFENIFLRHILLVRPYFLLSWLSLTLESDFKYLLSEHRRYFRQTKMHTSRSSQLFAQHGLNVRTIPIRNALDLFGDGIAIM
jgi:hypothetical protein